MVWLYKALSAEVYLDVSSEKGLLYYLHEPVDLSKAFGFSTIP